MLSSGALDKDCCGAPDNDISAQLQSFRESNGGCLSGMTRYSDHLDDMPAIGEFCTKHDGFGTKNHGVFTKTDGEYSKNDDFCALATGYARAGIAADRIQEYLLLLYGHAANYQGRGSFFTTEQQSLYQVCTQQSNPHHNMIGRGVQCILYLK